MVRNHGKWSDPGIPHKGWVCVDVEDLGKVDAVCEMFETQDIRYVHHMQHQNFPGTLGVGCICAEHMEGDSVGPRKRENALKNAARRKGNWLKRKWQTSEKGNPYINTDGLNIAIFRKPNGRWGGRIEDKLTGNYVFSHREYETKDKAKLAAFDAMIFLKAQRGWGV